MKDGCLTLKLKMLWLWRGSPLGWYREVWRQDGRQRMCCDGYMCGCCGADYASYWGWLWCDRGRAA